MIPQTPKHAHERAALRNGASQTAHHHFDVREDRRDDGFELVPRSRLRGAVPIRGALGALLPVRPVPLAELPTALESGRRVQRGGAQRAEE